MSRATSDGDLGASGEADAISGEVSLSTDTRGNTLRTARHRRAFVPVHPTQCGKYLLIAKIGHGGMAEVFLGVASGMGGFRKLAVVKRIHPQLLEEPEFVQMFLDEARLAAQLSHPNVVLTHEVGEHDGVPFIAMEYMEGQPYDKLLKAVRRAGNPMPMKLAVRVAMDALAGLHYAHELKGFDGTSLAVVHRDVSPSNIFITYQGTVKILDFGIAKASSKLSETRTGQIKGKLAYMAPEQARGRDVDRRADLWSIGVTLFETCTDTRLFKGESDVDTLQRVLTGDVDAYLAEHADRLPAPLLALIARSLSRDVEERPATAAAMRKELADLLPEIPGPDVDVADFVQEHFEELAASERSMLGDLMERADQVDRASLAPPEPSTAVTLVEGVSVDLESAPAQRRPSPLRAAIVALALIGLAIVGWQIYGRMVGDAAEATAPTASREAESAGAPRAAAAAGAITASRGEARAEPADPAPAGTPPTLAEGDTTPPEDEEAPAVEGEGAEGAAGANDLEARRQRWRRIQRSRAREQAAAGEGGAAVEESPSRASGQTGQLRLVTRPWSEVYLGGRRIGTTPLLGHRLPVGSHSLTLRNPEAGLETRVVVEIRADEVARLNISLE